MASSSSSSEPSSTSRTARKGTRGPAAKKLPIRNIVPRESETTSSSSSLVHSTSESAASTAALEAANSDVAAVSALQLLSAIKTEPSTSEIPEQLRRELLVRQPSYYKILNDLKGAEDMAKSEANSEVSTSEGSNSVQTITINGQQYQIVSALEGNAAGGASPPSGGSVIQYATATQNGQTVFVPSQNSVSAVSSAASSPQIVSVMGSPSGSHPRVAQDAARKREVRLMKNREAARECRNKKKEYIKCLENRVAVLENQNKALIEELKSLKELYTGQKS
ncbi:hypothetical protein TCAL_00359 [Tigriopus californicus]|uniref:BZIP domain-containing protein n=1 Tax=Tigriopus californicus TaxID=6832 RepID=A0A553NBT4_TIGCA|nr:cyclic AMP-responsive element-binding protein 1-like [Tigriopus californicus]TRY62877.1 hypothetical protein TCAL_00359 [Tigriopus californicus]|eukprot:TCALIF_00359-PA protein Name:"Similar to CREB1 Cyclic AMP-responsive element-binding protein 1 (Bos taurus)" AED:0.05 eAED:0.05 QI:0/-1/0/1/-1/1/1/0/278